MKNRYSPISQTTFLLLILISLSALLMRVQYLRLVDSQILIAKDAKQYVVYGRNLVHHGTFSKGDPATLPQPDSFRSPAYPLFIALFMLAGGESHYLQWLVYTQALLSTLLVPLTFFSGIFFLHTSAAIAAAVMVAISPHLITVTGCVLTETLFAFLLLSATCCFQYALHLHSLRLFIISAFLFGCAYLTNEASLFVPFLFGLIGWLSGDASKAGITRRRTVRLIAVYLSIAFMFPLGWALRNHLSVPSGAPRGSNRAIATMSHGAYPDFIYKSLYYKRFPYREDPSQPVFGSSIENFWRILWPRVKQDPVRYVRWYLVGKPYSLWSWDIIQGAGDIYIVPVEESLFQVTAVAASIREIMKIMHPVMLFLALSSIPAAFLGKRLWGNGGLACSSPVLPLTICIYFTLIYMVFAPWPRYGIPLRPELYLCAMWALTFFTRILGNRWWANDAYA
jgi:4-amino-4-deoxy-L-arabinose transferase-like glycosyltransferase